MATDLNSGVPERKKSPWFRVAQILLLVTFVAAVYLLGLNMVNHRFFRGGRIDRNGHLRQ
jgi:hypothetical protein